MYGNTNTVAAALTRGDVIVERHATGDVAHRIEVKTVEKFHKGTKVLVNNAAVYDIVQPLEVMTMGGGSTD